ncbi:hypothetical protein FACS189418_5610 [Clostridia bacterium]|nr:hypothetical protein FACS189418_5610 [Clostridia bacterium]
MSYYWLENNPLYGNPLSTIGLIGEVDEIEKQEIHSFAYWNVWTLDVEPDYLQEVICFPLFCVTEKIHQRYAMYLPDVIWKRVIIFSQNIQELYYIPNIPKLSIEESFIHTKNLGEDVLSFRFSQQQKSLPLCFQTTEKGYPKHLIVQEELVYSLGVRCLNGLSIHSVHIEMC